MPKRPVLECECARCHTKWYVDVPDGNKELELPAAKFMFSGPGVDPVSVEYDALCSRCATSVLGYIHRATLQAKALEADTAVAVEPPPLPPLPPETIAEEPPPPSPASRLPKY